MSFSAMTDTQLATEFRNRLQELEQIADIAVARTPSGSPERNVAVGLRRGVKGLHAHAAHAGEALPTVSQMVKQFGGPGK